MPQTLANPGHRALRCGRFSQPGRQYLVTMVTHKRRPIFNSLPCARAVIRSIRCHDDRGLVESQCFVLMPDHLHWLFALGTSKSLSDVMRDFKGYTARTINRIRFARTGAVWQPGFHDCALRREDDTRSLSRYVIRNPLRAGLVHNLRYYPHWDAWWFRPDHHTPMEAGLLGL